MNFKHCEYLTSRSNLHLEGEEFPIVETSCKHKSIIHASNFQFFSTCHNALHNFFATKLYFS
uniref:Uncharacterized protein n=1 Tax=Arundo donax TaxID=35708 RepID=A0A0A9F3G0_ARUDO